MAKVFGINEVATKSDLTEKQDTLVSGTNIKTINNQSILGSGNINIESAKSITFSAPSTATQGTITSEQLATLQENDNNYIIFNDEIFRLNDKQHESGYLVYSHNGHDTTGCFFQKCITITVSTLGWVLESQENASKTYVDEKITESYGYNVRVDGETLVFETVGNALQGDY